MLGYYRFVLTLFVLVGHAALFPPGVSRSAVMAFFIISGYLIGLTLESNYGSNTLSYYRNRVLRIFPLHIIVTATILLLYIGGQAEFMETFWALFGRDTPDFADTVGAFAITRQDAFLFSPTSWSLFYEVWFYLLAPVLLLGRGTVWVAALAGMLGWLAVGGDLGLITDPFGIDPALRSSIPVAAVFFAIGLSTQYVRRAYRHPFGRHARAVEWVALGALTLVFAMSLRWVTDGDLARFDETYSDSLHLAIIALTVLVLLACGRDGARSKHAADLTYPMYLFHWPVLFLLVGQQPQLIDLHRTLADALDPALSRLTGSGEAAGLAASLVLMTAATLALSQLWLEVEKRTFHRLRASRSGERPASAAPAAIASQAATPPAAATGSA